MSPDLKQTLPCDETQDSRQTRDSKEVAMSTTLIQPIPSAQKSELARTRYWEQRSSENQNEKRSAASYAAHGNTRVGLGPDDPLVQAVQAVKRQLMQASQQPTQISSAKTMVMPALASRQLLAAKAVPEERITITHVDAVHDPVTVPKRRTPPIAMVCVASGLLLTTFSIYGLSSRSTAPGPAATALVKPRPQAATTTPPAVERAAPPEATAPLPATSEKAAVDALFAGDYPLAQSHYRSLAQAHPEQPAFAEAARILSRRTQP